MNKLCENCMWKLPVNAELFTFMVCIRGAWKPGTGVVFIRRFALGLQAPWHCLRYFPWRFACEIHKGRLEISSMEGLRATRLLPPVKEYLSSWFSYLILLTQLSLLPAFYLCPLPLPLHHTHIHRHKHMHRHMRILAKCKISRIFVGVGMAEHCWERDREH